jgi:hypothetical protein
VQEGFYSNRTDFILRNFAAKMKREQRGLHHPLDLACANRRLRRGRRCGREVSRMLPSPPNCCRTRKTETLELPPPANRGQKLAPRENSLALLPPAEIRT